MKRIIYTFLICGLLSSCKENKPKSESAELKTESKVTKATISEKDILIGEYSFEENGEIVIKITKNDGKYYSTTKDNKGNWESPNEMMDEFQKENCEFMGFSDCSKFKNTYLFNAKCCGIFYVEKGTTIEWKTFKTGFFWMHMGLPDLYKK